MSDKLGRIKELDLREIFKDEARDLTPWLAKEENLEVLGAEIGTEIKLLQVEANFGRFNVDILAEEETSGKKIIIENQLETTDHDHLGKIITYASGHSAGIIIWIFRQIRDEHRKAIEWLNENTIENIDFFAIKIQLWQIDDSRPAPKFEIIVSPNEWAKTIRNKSIGEMTDTKLQQLEFWTKFKEYTHAKNKKIRFRAPRPQNSIDVGMSTPHAHIVLTVNTRERLLGCGLYIKKNKEFFNFARNRQENIEELLNAKLEWIDSGKASRITIAKSDFDLQDQNKYEQHFKWLYEMILQFKEVFSPLLNEFSSSSANKFADDFVNLI